MKIWDLDAEQNGLVLRGMTPPVDKSLFKNGIFLAFVCTVRMREEASVVVQQVKITYNISILHGFAPLLYF